ncbi:MAG: GxxExxY protein [Thermodesulfobacteriota bacterium]|nr:GxxExxY protein [Thermodesulfobacteriota bacterium]
MTETIIGCAYRVYNRTGFGFLEGVYEKCMLIELHKAGLRAESQKAITVYYITNQQDEKNIMSILLSCLKIDELYTAEEKPFRPCNCYQYKRWLPLFIKLISII